MLGLHGMFGVLSYVIAAECGRIWYGLFFMWKAACGVNSAEYRVHLVSV